MLFPGVPSSISQGAGSLAMIMQRPRNDAMALASEIENRWTDGVVLKRDLLSTVERGNCSPTPAGEVGRRAAPDRPGAMVELPLGAALVDRERRALALTG